MKKIIITAANGFLGEKLVQSLSKNYEVIGIVRNPKKTKLPCQLLQWNGKSFSGWEKELENAFAVINLAGRSVDCRYNEKNKKEIYSSRLNSTSIIGQAIQKCKNPPKIWLNSASATIYRHSEEMPMTEEKGEIGTGFSVDVCQKWEQLFFSFQHEKTRQVALRTTIVLAKEGGAFVPLRNLVKIFAGGKQGKGNQMFSWIHITDFTAAVEFILKNEALDGVVNLGSPFPIRNEELMKKMRKKFHRPFGMPMPKWLLEIGARIIQTETELIVKSRFVFPEKLIKSGFKFKFPTIEEAMEELQ